MGAVGPPPGSTAPRRRDFFGRTASMAFSVSAYLGDSSATSCFTAFLKGARSLTGVTVTPPALTFASASIS